MVCGGLNLLPDDTEPLPELVLLRRIGKLPCEDVGAVRACWPGVGAAAVAGAVYAGAGGAW